MPTLEVTANQKPVYYNFITYITIGRSSRSTIKIKDAKLSRVHCEIIKDDDDYILVDLHSQNGTKLNNKPVTEAILQDGDKITLGKTEVTFLIAERDQAVSTETTLESAELEENKTQELVPLKKIAVKKVGVKDIS